MARFKVRHGLHNYTKPDGTPGQAFRTMIVDMEDEDEIARGLKMGAIVPEDEELEKQGHMLALPESATDEQILAWVASATKSEVRQLVNERPMLAERLRAAAEQVQDRLEKQHELLSGVVKIADDASQDAAKDAAGRQAEIDAEAERRAEAARSAPPEPPVPGAVPLANSDGSPGDQGTTPSGDGSQTTTQGGSDDSESKPADEVVQGNVSDISRYLSTHANEAPLILEAENRRAESKQEQPRGGVVRAVQAAAGHAGQ